MRAKGTVRPSERPTMQSRAKSGSISVRSSVGRMSRQQTKVGSWVVEGHSGVRG